MIENEEIKDTGDMRKGGVMEGGISRIEKMIDVRELFIGFLFFVIFKEMNNYAWK